MPNIQRKETTLTLFDRYLVGLHCFWPKKGRFDSKDMEVLNTFYDEEGHDRENKFPRNPQQGPDREN